MTTKKPKSSAAFGLTTCLLSFFGLSISNARMPASFLVPLAAELEPDKKVIYKKAGDRELELHLFHPRNFQPATDRRPVFLIIHGGGWTGGKPRKFYPIAKNFADLGMLGISLQYRLLSTKEATTVFDCVKDGRSAIRYLRANAKTLGIDADKIVVSGGSAGGHVAVATALFDQVNESSDDISISCLPDALVLLNPVIDTSEKGYGQEKFGDGWKELSPINQVKANLPPTIIFHSTNDQVVPFDGAKKFTERSQKLGNDCQLVTHEGGRHGYFIFDEKLYQTVIAKTEKFLKNKGFFAR